MTVNSPIMVCLLFGNLSAFTGLEIQPRPSERKKLLGESTWRIRIRNGIHDETIRPVGYFIRIWNIAALVNH